MHQHKKALSAPLPPAFVHPLEQRTDLQQVGIDAVSSHRDVEGMHFLGGTLTGLTGECLEFSGCIFERCHLESMDIRRISFVDCLFQHCDTSNMRFINCTFQRVRFENCRMTGVDMGDTLWMNASLHHCQMEYAAFSDTKWDRCLLEGCRLRESQWIHVRLLRTRFSQCDLLQAQWDHTPLEGMDVTTCQIGGWRISPFDIKGLQVRPTQALELSSLLGLTIVEE